MKKFTLLLFILSHFFHFSLAQNEKSTYDNLFKKSDSLGEVKDYKNSAIIGSEAIRMAGNKATLFNYWGVADSWALAGYADSAFYLLNIISGLDNLAMNNFRNIRSDKDFISLRNDKRWETILKKIYSQAEKNVINIRTGIKIKVRDGIFLNATIYQPQLQSKPLPVIFSLTPYISDTYHERGVYFAQHDYVYANIDVRGRGSSAGTFDPFFNDAKDGYDIVEWFARQSYCNGKIAMWGGSYAGEAQWLTAKEFPPHLKSIVPVASPRLGIDHPMIYNVGVPYISQWLMFTSTQSGNLNLFQDTKYWENKFTERYEKDLPFASMDSIIGYPNKIWKNYIDHQSYDNYYKSVIPTPTQYAKMNLPILTITGSYDGNQPGALSFYSEFMKYAASPARENHYLIIGPWDHAGTRTPIKVQAGITMGDSSLLDMNNLHWQWYNYTLKDSIKPPFLRDKVMYFVANKNRWKSAKKLDDIGKEKMKLYLNSFYSTGKNLPDSASLENETPANSNPAKYIYDPLNKTETGSVVYNSLPFKEDVEVSGFFQLNMHIETNVKDVDIRAQIFEITSSNRRISLTSQVMRARYRESLEKEKLLIPGEINLFRFDNFTFISRVIEKGSRIQLIISSPNSPYDQKNYCSGGNVAFETAKDSHIATVKIYNDSKHPSIIYIPIVK